MQAHTLDILIAAQLINTFIRDRWHMCHTLSNTSKTFVQPQYLCATPSHGTWPDAAIFGSVPLVTLVPLYWIRPVRISSGSSQSMIHSSISRDCRISVLATSESGKQTSSAWMRRPSSQYRRPHGMQVFRFFFETFLNLSQFRNGGEGVRHLSQINYLNSFGQKHSIADNRPSTQPGTRVALHLT